MIAFLSKILQKLAQLQSSVNAIPTVTPQRPRSTYAGSFRTTSTSFVTALNITGTGKLIALQVSNAHIQIIADGNTILDFNNGDTNAIDSVGDYTANYQGISSVNISFKSNLKINLSVPSSGTATIKYTYELE